jgi:fibronectin type 3 domain-containing protein
MFALTACGKVGAPQPPFVRIPEAVKDLAVTQRGHDLILTWTNPPRYIDGSTATDLVRVQINAGGIPLASPEVNGPGQPQSYTMSIGSDTDTPRTFSITVETGQGKQSAASNVASITPIDVPGSVSALTPTVDQRRIVLKWNAPTDHGELADAYVVTRSDLPAEPATVINTNYEDSRYSLGKVVTYQVTPARRITDSLVMGVTSAPVTVTVEDKVPPKVPNGLEIRDSGAGSAFLTWDANEENDLAGYHVFRSDRPDGDFKKLTDRLIARNAFVDPEYKAGAYYAVSATDDSGNESSMSPPFRAP